MIFCNARQPMKKKIRLSLSTTTIIFLLGTLLAAVFILQGYFFEKNRLINEAFDNLTNVTVSKSEKIKEKLESVYSDIASLQASTEVKDLLKHHLVDSAFSAQEDIQRISEEIAAEINAYLITHPQATVKDLQKNEFFQNLAVQHIGKTGYSAIYETESLIDRFHINPAIVDTDLNLLADEFPKFYEIILASREGENSAGFYDWRDADGVIRSKYMSTTIIDTRTADGIELAVAATTYPSEYKTIELENKDDIARIKFAISHDIRSIADTILKDVENYIATHPDMTLSDLQGSPEFQKIAVHPVGKSGYSFVFDAKSLINYFHLEPRRQGYDYNQLQTTFPALWSMLQEVAETEYTEGFYSRDEVDGNISKKYGVFIRIPAKTADGVSLAVGVTGYLEDYEVVAQTSKYLEDFNAEASYNNIALISKKGSVIYLAQGHEGLGINLGWESSLDYGLAKNYQKTKQHNDIALYGPFIDRYGDISPKFSVMAPISESGNVLGYVALIDDMEQIFEITETTDQLGQTGESFLVNQDLLLISPLRRKDFDIMVQSVDTENSARCFSMSMTGEHIGHKPIDIMTNYRGDDVVATHDVITSPHWCLIVEIEKAEEIDEPLRKFIKHRIYIMLVIVLIIFGLGFLMSSNCQTLFKKFSRKK